MSTQNEMRALDNRPLYLQAVDVLRDFMATGGFKPGDMLPTGEELARQLGISRTTLREALGFLEREGRVSRRHGVGTFVAQLARSHELHGLDQLGAMRAWGEARNVHVEAIQCLAENSLADVELANVLQVKPGTPVYRTRVVMAVEESRVAYFDSVVLTSTFDPLQPPDGTKGVLEYLLGLTPPPVAYSFSEIFSVNADASIAAELGVAEGKAVLLLVETYCDDDDRPIGRARDYYITDTFNYAIVRRVRSRLPPG